MSEELINCAHCNGEATVEDGRWHTWVIVCDDCGATSDSFATKAEAIAAWNKRFVRNDKNGKPVFAGDEVRCVPLDFVKITHPDKGTVVWCELIYGWTIAVGKRKYALKDFAEIELVEESEAPDGE